jgi:tRNA threonylcarbamoyladenosine biosynthesis protein TsaE
MMHGRSLVVHTTGVDETRAFAERLGRLSEAGDVLCLIGELGAGKTTFTQGLALGLDLPPDEPINSPTFTLVAEHHGGRLPLYHFDVYRLIDSSGLYGLAYDDYLDSDGIVVIEWADKVADALPADRLELVFTTTKEEERDLTLTPYGKRAGQLMQYMAMELPR